MSIITSAKVMLSGPRLEQAGYYPIRQSNSGVMPELPGYKKTDRICSLHEWYGREEPWLEYRVHRFVFLPNAWSIEYAEFLDAPNYQRRCSFYPEDIIHQFQQSLLWVYPNLNHQSNTSLTSFLSIGLGAVIGAVSGGIHLSNPEFIPLNPFSGWGGVGVFFGSLLTGAAIGGAVGLYVVTSMDKTESEPRRAEFRQYLDRAATITVLETGSALEAALRKEPMSKLECDKPTYLNI